MHSQKLITTPPDLLETTTIPLNVTMVGIDYCQEHYRIVRNVSATSVVGYVVAGCGTFHVGTQTFSAAAGDTFVIPAGKSQEYYPSGTEPWVFLWSNIKGTLLVKMLEAYGLEDCHLFAGCTVEHLLRKALTIAERKQDMPIDLLQKTMNTVVMEILMEIVYFQSGLRNKLSAEVMKIKSFLDRNLEEHVTLDMLREVTPLTVRHINRLFRKELGTTPYKYLLENKLELAKSLLLNTNLPLAEIAAKLKFADAFYFSNLFKKKTGMSPLHFRMGHKTSCLPES